MLTIAGRAPSAWNLLSWWRFVVVTEPELKQKLQQAAFNQPQVGAAAAVIVLYSDMADTLGRLDELVPQNATDEVKAKIKGNITGAFSRFDEAGREQWGRNQAYIALGYLLLTLEVYGFGSSPMLGFDPAAVKSLLDLPGNVEVPALVAVGHPAEEGRPSDRLPLRRSPLSANLLAAAGRLYLQSHAKNSDPAAVTSPCLALSAKRRPFPRLTGDRRRRPSRSRNLEADRRSRRWSRRACGRDPHSRR